MQALLKANSYYSNPFIPLLGEHMFTSTDVKWGLLIIYSSSVGMRTVPIKGTLHIYFVRFFPN